MLILHFELYIKFNFSLISVLIKFAIRISIPFSNFDYSSNSHPNHLIFDSVDLKLSYLS